MPNGHAGMSAFPVAGFCAALGLAIISCSAEAQAQSCTQTIEFLNAAKTAQVGHRHEQQQLQEKIQKLNDGEASFRRKLETQQCRPKDATDDAKQHLTSCEFYLKVILDTQKVRSDFERQLAGLKKKTTDAAGVEQNLVQQATLNGCPPYGKEPVKKATAPAPEPKKAAKKHRKHHVRAQRPPPERDPERYRARRSGGPVIHFGGGGVGIGFGF